MSVIASQITSPTIVYSTVYSGADQRKHQSSTSLAFVRGIHRSPVNSPHKGPVTPNRFPFDDVIMKVLRWVINSICIIQSVTSRHCLHMTRQCKCSEQLGLWANKWHDISRPLGRMGRCLFQKFVGAGRDGRHSSLPTSEKKMAPIKGELWNVFWEHWEVIHGFMRFNCILLYFLQAYILGAREISSGPNISMSVLLTSSW